MHWRLRSENSIERVNNQWTEKELHDALQRLFCELDLKAPSSFCDLGPTRTPWPGQAAKQKPSVIDYLLTSQKSICTILTTDRSTPAIATDHSPIGMTVHAPYASRKHRRRLFEHLLSDQRRYDTTIPTTKEPD